MDDSEFKEIDTSYSVDAADRNLDPDDLGETIFPLESFFGVFTQLAQAFLDGDLKVIQESFAWLQSVLVTVSRIPFEEFEGLNVQQFFFDFLNTFECHYFFPDALRILNIFISNPEFQSEIFKTEEFFEILLTEVRPHLKYKSAAIELIAKLIDGDPDAKEQFLNNDNENFTYLITLYKDEYENDVFQKEAIIYLLRVLVNTPPLLVDELMAPVLEFAKTVFEKAEEITEEKAMLFRDIIKIDIDYAKTIMEGHNIHTLWSNVASKDTSKDIKIIIIEVLYYLAEKDYPELDRNVFWPSIINALVLLSDEDIRLKILDIIKLIINKYPLTIISSTDYKVINVIFNLARYYQYKLKVSALELLAILIFNEDDIKGIIPALVHAGYLNLIKPFISTQIGPLLLKTIYYIADYAEKSGDNLDQFFYDSGILLDLVDNELENEDDPDSDVAMSDLILLILSYESIQTIFSNIYGCSKQNIKEILSNDSSSLSRIAAPSQQLQGEEEDAVNDGTTVEPAQAVEDHLQQFTEEQFQEMVDFYIIQGLYYDPPKTAKEHETNEEEDQNSKPNGPPKSEPEILYSGDLNDHFVEFRQQFGLPFNSETLKHFLRSIGEYQEEEEDHE